MALEFTAAKLRADRDVILEAIANNWQALQFAAAELRADRNVVLEAVMKDGRAFQIRSWLLHSRPRIAFPPPPQSASHGGLGPASQGSGDWGVDELRVFYSDEAHFFLFYLYEWLHVVGSIRISCPIGYSSAAVQASLAGPARTGSFPASQAGRTRAPCGSCRGSPSGLGLSSGSGRGIGRASARLPCSLYTSSS